MSEHLNCCAEPALEVMKLLYAKSHDSEDVSRCTSCGARWFHRWHERMKSDGGADSMIDWYTRITDEECRILVSAKQRPDLSFLGLTKRAAICIDEDGAREVSGQPGYPWG